MTWRAVTEQEPRLAGVALDLFRANKHLMLATLRADGSPRICGIEMQMHSGDIYLGGIAGSLKFVDLRRDPRYALHSTNPADRWSGDAKIAGVAVEVFDGERARVLAGMEEGEVFRLEVSELSLVRLGQPADHLVIEVWHPGQPVRRFRR